MYGLKYFFLYNGQIEGFLKNFIFSKVNEIL